MRLLKNIFESICANILPTSCIACGVFQELPLCKSCEEAIQITGLFNYECCKQCGITLREIEIPHQCCNSCQKNSPYFDATHCLDRYEGPLQECLHQFKYQKRLAYGNGLAYAWNLFMGSQLENMDAHFLLPVPLSKQKLCTRGFNQSWEIAKRIHCGGHIEKLPQILLRHHHYQHQALASKVIRHQTVQDMFYLEKKHASIFRDRTIIVFDDVMTSGATLNEIARILKDNGASRVINWVLLRTQQPQ